MKKLLPLLAFTAISALPLRAQLPDGIVAPNFTATDINGNTWTLYDLLDQGKSAVLFFGTTWSYNSWQYHMSGRLNQVYEQYGPGGTDEIIPFFVEADDNTTPEDLNGTGGSTYGDWVTGTPYPILDDANWLAVLYALDDVPRVYMICPNRILTNAIAYPTVQFHLAHGDCLLPAGANNAGMLRYVNLPKEFCGETTFAPSVRFQNLGTAQMTSLNLELLLNGNLAETRQWTGNLALYQTAGITFNPVTITGNTVVDVAIATVNGLPDEDISNDTLQSEVAEGPVINTNFLVVEIKTDYYPRETYWEVVDDAGTVFHSGGNRGIFTGEVWEGAYTGQETVYQHEVTLPTDGCYEFVIYDSYDDGICCDEGLGYYRLQHENNFIYLQGGLFAEPEHRPFELSGASTIENNAAIRSYEGFNGDFCGELTYTPVFAVQNIGANPINSLQIEAVRNGETLQTFTWNGTLASGQTDTIATAPLTLDTTSTVDFVISEANGQPDTFFFQNETEVRFFRRQPQTVDLTLEFATDQWGYENYWQITNSAGDLIASGSNQLIGPNGGGLRVAQATDPGSYPPFSTITEQISLPADVNDCYEFLFVDDWGDGINAPGGIKLTDNLGHLLFNFRPLGTYDSRLIDGQFGPSAAGEPVQETVVRLSPNPATDRLDVDFSFGENTSPVQLEIVSTVGQVLRQVELPAGQQRHSLDVANLGNGIYFLKIKTADGRQAVRRFVVASK
ncbi:MAG: T9SS type A sorting domain-containing protein [Bacteroidetes bacterium]|nr:T9SS type A sorting domain-containing protein [Bacteroidota bacterium]